MLQVQTARGTGIDTGPWSPHPEVSVLRVTQRCERQGAWKRLQKELRGPAQIQLSHLLSVWPWASHQTSQSLSVISCKTKITSCASWDGCKDWRLIHAKNLLPRSCATHSSSSQYYYLNYSWVSIRFKVLFHKLSAFGSLHTHTKAKRCCPSTCSSGWALPSIVTWSFFYP